MTIRTRGASGTGTRPPFTGAPPRRRDARPGAPAEPAPANRRERRPGRWLGPGIALLLFFVALHVLRGELHAYGYREIAAAVRATPTERLLAALAFTALSYLVLPWYDGLGLAYAGRTGARRLPARRIWAGGATAYGLSQTLGMPSLTGSAVRQRFWSAWGLSSTEIVRAAAFSGATFMLGVALVSGAALLIEPSATLARVDISDVAARAIGAALLVTVGALAGWSATHGGRSLRPPRWLVGRIPAAERWRVTLPGPRLVVAQLVVALVDWTAAACVLFVLLPDRTPLHFLPFAGIFVLAQFAGLVSHVPGGLGVFETLVVLLLAPYLPPGETLAAVVAYRFIYYLLPFAVAVGLLTVHELRTHGAELVAGVGVGVARTGVVAARARVGIARIGTVIIPLVASGASFVAGAVLLWSGATPGARGRIAAIERLLPLGIVDASHLVASLVGTALLVLAWALRHRIGAAWGMAVALLMLGIASSLLEGLAWEQALLLASVLAVVLPFRRAFYRRSALTAEPLEPGWLLAILAVVGASVWVGLFSYRHIEYGSDLWWRVGRHADAARFLRASVTSAAGLALFGLARLLRHAPAEPALPSPDELARAERIALRAHDTGAYLALLGDKPLLFAESVADSSSADARCIDGFVQYAVAGRSWVALGDPVVVAADPVASAEAQRVRAELAWRFRESADRHGGWPVFYEVGAGSLPLYIDLGLTFLKLGERARVELGAFSLEGGRRRGLRRTVKDVERAGARFEVVPAVRVPALLPRLRTVSDDWLASKRVREKGFSLGFFDEHYLRRFPVAVVTAPRDGAEDIVAFASLWPGGDREELSADLMRFATDAPRGVMEYLFVQLMLWGKGEGYRWFDLGMAPLAGLEARQLAPLWAKAGAWLYRHGEHFYNYQGLRLFKAKFDPVWEPQYLASPGGLALPRILASVASLISGGVTGIVRK